MRRPAARGRRAALIFVACWAVPGAAFCALAFQGGFVAGQPVAAYPAWTAGPAGAALTVVAILYAVSWLSLPVVLLAVGIDQLGAGAPAVRPWPALWTATVAAGTALDPLGLWALNTTHSGGGFQWAWLAATVGYLAVGAAMAAILIAAPRSPATAGPATGVSAP
jgi:hypothetical protein